MPDRYGPSNEAEYKLTPELIQKLRDKGFLSPTTLAVTLSKRGNSSIYYMPDQFDNPITQTHERIHVAQNKFTQPITHKEILSLWPGVEKYQQQFGRHFSSEIPAYLLSESSRDKPEDSARYLDLLRMRGEPERATLGIEQALNPDVLRELIRTKALGMRFQIPEGLK